MLNTLSKSAAHIEPRRVSAGKIVKKYLPSTSSKLKAGNSSSLVERKLAINDGIREQKNMELCGVPNIIPSLIIRKELPNSQLKPGYKLVPKRLKITVSKSSNDHGLAKQGNKQMLPETNLFDQDLSLKPDLMKTTFHSISRKVIPLKDRCFNPEEHCGVATGSEGGPCTRSLTCKTHSIALRRAVAGRSQSFDVLLATQKRVREIKPTNKEVSVCPYT